MPKPSGKMTDADRAIAKRVRIVRFQLQMSVAEFSNVLGFSANKLAGVEYERTPLTVEIADKISSEFDISLLWLAHGRGRMKPCIGLVAQICPEIKGSSPLSRSVDDAFEARAKDNSILGMLSFAAIMTGRIVFSTEREALNFKEHIQSHFDDLFAGLPLEGKGKLLALMLRTFAKFGGDWSTGNKKNPGENIVMLPKNRNYSLTDSESHVSIGAVKARLPELLARLKEATLAPGKKTELAEFLSKATGDKVPLASVSRWLAGEREPGGEIALQMDAWATKQGFPK